MIRVVRGRHVLVGLVVAAAAAIDGLAAAAQAPPPPTPVSSTPQAPDRGRQQAADARYKVRVMEGVLESRCSRRLRLNEQPHASLLIHPAAGAAYARGAGLKATACSSTSRCRAMPDDGLTARVMRQQHAGVSGARRASRITGGFAPGPAPKRTRDAADRAGRPPGPARLRPASADGRRAPPAVRLGR